MSSHVSDTGEKGVVLVGMHELPTDRDADDDGVINRGFDGDAGTKESSMDVNSHPQQPTDDIEELTPSTQVSQQSLVRLLFSLLE